MLKNDALMSWRVLSCNCELGVFSGSYSNFMHRVIGGYFYLTVSLGRFAGSCVRGICTMYMQRRDIAVCPITYLCAVDSGTVILPKRHPFVVQSAIKRKRSGRDHDNGPTMVWTDVATTHHQFLHPHTRHH